MNLQTAPNSGAPVGLRKKIAADVGHDAAKHAAGILYVAPDGDVLLLRRSSNEANFSGHWALPGGGVEPGETPHDGALREAREEMGVDTKTSGMKTLDRRITPTGTAFHTFAAPVAEKFVPRLNDEHSGYAWAPLHQLPKPMHPAVEQTLHEQLGVAADMKPEDWAGLRDGFLKWTLEEEAEPEHAADSVVEVDLDDEDGQLQKLLAYIRKNSSVGHSFGVVVDPEDRELAKKFYIDGDGAFRIRSIKVDGKVAADAVMALDRDSVRQLDADGRLHVAITNLSKATVNPYRGKEIPNYEELGLEPNEVYQLFRDPAELEKAVPTFNGIQVLQKHIPVSAVDHQPYDVVGATGTDAKFEYPYLRNSLVVWAQGAIDAIESDEKKELSCGYRYRAEMTPGNFDGMRYDGVMRDIVGNHVALVKDGRAGPDVVVGDSREILDMKPTRFAALALRTTALALAPLMAMDAKAITLPSVSFKDLTTKNYDEKRPALLAALKAATAGKLANDADLEQVVELLDAIGAGKKESLDAVDPLAEKSMEEPTTVNPMAAVTKDAGMEGFKGFLKEKGMGDADIKAACDMVMPKAKDAAVEETPEAKKKREDDEKAKAALDAETPEQKAEREKTEKAAKDASMKDMVTKPALDAAIDAAVKAVRTNEQGIRTALAEVRPYVGELPETMAFDSAEGVYRHALTALGVEGAKTIHVSALPTILKMQTKPGARPVDNGHSHIAMDAAASKSFADRFPGADRIGAA